MLVRHVLAAHFTFTLYAGAHPHHVCIVVYYLCSQKRNPREGCLKQLINIHVQVFE